MILHDSDDELENLPLMQEAVDDQEGQIRLSLQMDQSNIASFDDSGHSAIRGANILDLNIPIGGFDLEPQVQLAPMDMNAPPELGLQEHVGPEPKPIILEPVNFLPLEILEENLMNDPEILEENLVQIGQIE